MRKIMLNGRWELAEAGKDTLCAVQVPGSVLSGLYGAGKIEDPFYRTNEDATRELFWKDYEFCRTFAVTEDVLNEKKRKVVIGIDGQFEECMESAEGLRVGQSRVSPDVLMGNFRVVHQSVDLLKQGVGTGKDGDG